MARTDAERLAFLIDKYAHCKWADVLPDLRPMEDDGSYAEKYVNPKTFRDHLDAAIEREGWTQQAVPRAL